MVPPWGNSAHNNIFVLMCKYTAIQARAKPKTFYVANGRHFCLTLNKSVSQWQHHDSHKTRDGTQHIINV